MRGTGMRCAVLCCVLCMCARCACVHNHCYTMRPQPLVHNAALGLHNQPSF